MNKVAFSLCLSCAVIFCILITLLLAGFKFNSSDSIPKGIYRMHTGVIKKNHLVLFCPDDREAFRLGKSRGYLNHGFCPDDYGYLMKQVVAMEGDVVSSTDHGVFVNHMLIPFSQPQIHDGLKRPLNLWRIKNYRLKSGQLITMTNQSIWSFDSRYYGLIQINQVKGIITPVLTW